eukprot:scaffold18702_cov54-Phaeocystis_antarctica.AAC.6
MAASVAASVAPAVALLAASVAASVAAPGRAFRSSLSCQVASPFLSSQSHLEPSGESAVHGPSCGHPLSAQTGASGSGPGASVPATPARCMFQAALLGRLNPWVSSAVLATPNLICGTEKSSAVIASRRVVCARALPRHAGPAPLRGHDAAHGGGRRRLEHRTAARAALGLPPRVAITAAAAAAGGAR